MLFNNKEVKILMVDFVGLEKTTKVLSYAIGLASLSKDPIAKAIAKMDPRIDKADAKLEKEFKNFGLLGKVGDDKVLLATDSVLKENGIDPKNNSDHKVFFAINNEVQAVFRIDN